MPALLTPDEDGIFLVTGGAGFIGSHIARDLAEAGCRVVVADRLRSGGKWRNLAAVRLHDLIPPEAIFTWLDGHRRELGAIVHMAAVSATNEPDIERYVVNNIRLSLDLWGWCAANAARLIYASSAATYGNGEGGFIDDEAPTALARLQPLNAYGWSKHIVDRRVIDDVVHGRPQPAQWAGLKFFNVYGAHETHKGEMQSMVSKLAPIVRAGGRVSLFRSHHPRYADGGQLRDFVYVKDCAAVVHWLLANPLVNGLYNVGSGAARSFLDLARAVGEAVGREPDITFIETPPSLRGQYQYFTQADLTKLRAAGFQGIFHSLEAGIRDCVASLP
jgi:ADP-L-glycero-D-manno-heptose 6-epimerase